MPTKYGVSGVVSSGWSSKGRSDVELEAIFNNILPSILTITFQAEITAGQGGSKISAQPNKGNTTYSSTTVVPGPGNHSYTIYSYQYRYRTVPGSG